MKKLTDQELDSIFKNADEGFEPSFDSAAWDAMNAKLDQPKPTTWKAWMPFVLLGVVIFSTGVWVGTHFNENRSVSESILKSISKESIQQKNATAKENQDQVQLTIHQASVEKETVIEKQLHEVTDGKELNKALRINNKVVEKSKPTLITDRSDPLDAPKFHLQEVKNSNEFINKVSDNPVDTLSQQAVVDEAMTDTVLLNSEEGKEISMAINRHTIYLRALASPDFSSINYASASETGSNYSLLVEYQVTNRWSISTGGIWSMKKYSSDQEVTYGKYTADRMVGACEILDIPLNVYYRFRPHLKTSFYAGIGFSSYIMLQENYTYTVDYSSGSRDYSYTIERKNNEWFKMLNLSIGIQYQIAPRFYLQAEPFLKAPLAGVGEWDVQLSSMGIFLGVKYRIN